MKMDRGTTVPQIRDGGESKFFAHESTDSYQHWRCKDTIIGPIYGTDGSSV